MSKPALAALTPVFKPNQHQGYVDHLSAALDEPGVCNIALTGRYGAGKSSVLAEFARQNQKRVLFLSLSTLGPDSVDDSRTNQIEKELVKQLLHREKPARLPQSRYQRIDRLPAWRAFTEAAVALATVGLLLWLFGSFPDIPGLSRGDVPKAVRVAAATIALAIVIAALAWIRIVVHNRFVVSEVSAGGASITLAKKSESYFNQYLDEIVYFFESMRHIDVVIFEDLDRFDEPGIFEALRELNTLLNGSKQTTRRAFGRKRRTIRFVYALRDSIFEKLGHDTKELENDAAQAESVRANRTKFFDLVIPIVPFITHRTSRELLSRIIKDDGLTPVPQVSDELVDLAARYLPDMRLLTNIRNEYSIFAKRLIIEKQGMDTLTANQLFAMVVYKNIHLEDFELMLLGRGDLDTVYQLSRDMVTEAITTRRARLAKVTSGAALKEALRSKAQNWGERLNWFFAKSTESAYRGTHIGYTIGNNQYSVDDATKPNFWLEVLDTNTGVTGRVQNPNYNRIEVVSLTMDEVQLVLGAGVKLDDWEKDTQPQLNREEGRLKADLDFLRTADFTDLAKRPNITLTVDTQLHSFRGLVAKHIKSELGRALVNDGFIDRYYTLYVAQYYGDRVPPNALNYIVQNVDTNRTDINYQFKNPSEIAAVLKETNGSFLSDPSAYNINILDYLLEHSEAGARVVLDSLVRHVGNTEQAFLDAYLSEGTQAAKAAAYLAERWPAILTQVIETVGLAHARRIELVDAALAHSSDDVTYDLDDTVRTFLQANYKEFCTIAQPQAGEDSASASGVDPDPALVRNAVTTMGRAAVLFDDLTALCTLAVRLVVEQDCYAITAANLRTALGDPETLSLDRIRSIDPAVFEDVLDHPDEYLEAIKTDTASPDTTGPRWTIEEPSAFSDIVTNLADLPKAQSVAIIQLAHPDGAVEDLYTVPDTTWEALAHCQRFPPMLGNVDAHIKHLGEVDRDLASLLTTAGHIVVPQVDDGAALAGTESSDDGISKEADEVEVSKGRVAAAVIQAQQSIPSASVRARIVGSLNLGSWFPVGKVPSEQGQLLGHLLREHICRDEAATFAHFDTADWETLSYGIIQSTKFAEFVTPELLSPAMTALLLVCDDITAELKHIILSRFDEFVPADNDATLTAAGRSAVDTNFSLSAAQVTTIAHGTGDSDLIVRLLNHFQTDLTIDQVLDALVQLPDPYSRLTTAGEKLTFLRDDPHEVILKRIQAEGRITSRVYAKSLRKSARIEVTVH
ncbi:hypothetical protein [Kribbella rubisoli]|nr:hypothetical protein [Kribbella rubisoli]